MLESALEPVAENIWTLSAPQQFLMFHVGTKMTVIRLSSGKLVLHSPVPVSDQVRRELNELGEVSDIICPNHYHHLYAGEVKAHYPQARLHGPPSLAKKRKDLKFDHLLGGEPLPDWGGELEMLNIEGTLLNETVFFHPASATLISCDLVENFRTSGHLPTLLWLKSGGIHGKVGWHHLLKLLYVNRRKARRSIEAMLQWPFDKAIIAHGRILENNARETMREAFGWLLR